MRCLAATLALPCALALLAAAPPAHAGEPRTHDGFYLRLGGGLGFTYDAVKSEPYLGDEISGHISGLALTGEAAVGATVLPGLALGAGLLPTYVPDPRGTGGWTLAGTELEADIDYRGGSMLLMAGIVDFYPSPTGGLHLQAALGYTLLGLATGDAVLNTGSERKFEPQSGGGFGFGLGVGQEFWVSDEIGLGVLARVQVVLARGEDVDEVEWHHRVITPALLFTATMN